MQTLELVAACPEHTLDDVHALGAAVDASAERCQGDVPLVAVEDVTVLISLILLQFTPYAISWEQLSSGLSFSLPPAVTGVAIGAFVITGVGGHEIMFYNYWCIEKGYAAYAGPNDGTPEWADRAKGWIKVMYLDAVCSMIVYTLVTAAFFLQGAALLHEHGE